MLAETPGGDPGNVVMAGAHLDSVNAGPGINDNGSGSAALIEVAEQMAKVKPRNKVRFAWWGAEEANLVGSTYYVNNLSAAERAKVSLYLNFDMIGSPNHVFFIYDGDDSDGVGAGAGPRRIGPDREDVRAVLHPGRRAVQGHGLLGPFRLRAVHRRQGSHPVASSPARRASRRRQEAAVFGGTAGIPYDPCYHEACDTFANNNDHALQVNSDGVAYAVLQYAMSTLAINGQRGKGNFTPPRDEVVNS